MERIEIKKSIDEAAKALRIYYTIGMNKSASFTEQEDIERVEESIEILKKSFMLGPSGQTCPACGGSGKI